MDILSTTERSKRMGLIRSKNTRPEIRVRGLIRALGYKYRLHSKTLPGKPDIVLSRAKKAIFVHGCFWHRHSALKCKMARLPKSKTDYWLPKLERNKKRDLSHQRKLRKIGWSVMIVWECELKNPSKLSARLDRFLSS
jgi:DNA mismatch endonuclease, patch repair protein